MLMCDMVLNDVTLEWDENGELITDTENLLRWPMIGDGRTETGFSGIFDGNGHVISGMVVITEPVANTAGYAGAGFFHS